MKIIDADALLQRAVPHGWSTPLWVSDIMIKDAPAIDVQPVVHGRWIGKPIAGYSTVRCSVCKSVFSENNGKWNYCPSCGALMDEVKNENKLQSKINALESI